MTSEAAAQVALDPRVAEVCRCPDCRAGLSTEGGLRCTGCGREFSVADGIPVLLPGETDERRDAYRHNYDRIARDDLEHPIVERRDELLHSKLLAFLGDTAGKRVLDIGSAYGSYLARLDAAEKVAVDLALPYLREIDPAAALRVCGDAEALPVRLDRFDVVIVADLLEHLLEPQRLVDRLAAELRPEARVIVHVPWRESLEQYRDSPYEFVHLRSFDDYSFRSLFHAFSVVRERSSLPRIDAPLVFRLRGKLPKRLYDELVALYFASDLQQIEYRRRERWIRELPRRERFLLRFYPPTFKLFELRPRPHASLPVRVAARLLRRYA